ncbi:DUF6304 family protein [Providencia sp.]|uniref:DUF6304 family protein n=1 Tax=Providencia sp. TaxID=589 RepID=UPI00333EA78B
MSLKSFYWPLTYIDSYGSNHTTVTSDGYSLQFTLRGICFIGTAFNLLSFNLLEKQYVERHFDIDEYETLQGLFSVELKLPVMYCQQRDFANLKLAFDYCHNRNDITYIFNYQGQALTSEQRFSFIEDLLFDIQQKLPQSTQLHCCMTCRYSHYHPVGNNDFGGLACFKLLRKQAEKVQDKSAVMALFEQSVEEGKHRVVQETFLCSSYQTIEENWCYKRF